MAAALSAREQALLMTVRREQVVHWLFPERRDLSIAWPLMLPDGGTVGAGAELDRLFRIAACLAPQVRDTVQA